MRRLLCTILVLVLSLFSLLGYAKPNAGYDQAESSNDKYVGKDYFRQGIQFFNDGEFEEAVKHFRMAYKARRNYKILYNIAQSEMSAKRYGLALEAFQNYLEKGGDDVSKERREQIIQEIDVLQQMVGNVFVKAAPGCLISINKVSRGTSPITKAILLKVGYDHSVQIVCKDKTIYTAKISLNAGQKIHIDAIKGSRKVAEASDSIGKNESTEKEADDEERRKLLKQYTNNKDGARDMALAFMIPGVLSGATGGLLFINESTRGYGLAMMIVPTSVFLVGAVVGLSSYQRKKKKMYQLEDSLTLSTNDKRALLFKKMASYKITGSVFISIAAVALTTGGVLLGAGFAKDSDDFKEFGISALVPGTALLTQSIILFSFYSRDKRKYNELTEQKSKKTNNVTLLPSVSPNRNGGFFSLQGTF